MTLRIGLVAAARITEKAVVDPARDLDGVEVVAVGARDAARAAEAAARWDVPRSVGSYEDLVADEEVDAVYIATPAGKHMECTLAALEVGKHVLCEKPLANNADQARLMVDAGRRAFESDGTILMEAFHWRYHPFVDRIAAVLDSGVVGDIERVAARFVVPDGAIPRTDIRWDLELGGGALMDLGCYPVQWVRFVAGPEPKVTSAVAHCPVPEVDGHLVAELEWSSGVTGRIATSMTETGPDALAADLTVSGTAGTMVATNPLHPSSGASIVVDAPGGDAFATDEVDPRTTYFHQLAAFRDAVASGEMPPTGGDDSVQTMAVIDECYLVAGLHPRPS